MLAGCLCEWQSCGGSLCLGLGFGSLQAVEWLVVEEAVDMMDGLNA